MSYIVIRRAPDLPEEFDIGDLEGKWFDGAKLKPLASVYVSTLLPFEGVAVATGRIERREDGEHAEVYEVRL